MSEGRGGWLHNLHLGKRSLPRWGTKARIPEAIPPSSPYLSVYHSELRDGKDLSAPRLHCHTLPAWLSLPQVEAHPAMLVVETLLAKDKEERPRREPSRDCRKLSEG